MDTNTPATESSPGGVPIQDRPTEVNPVQAKPTEANPVQAKPTEANPVQAKPTEANSVQQRSAHVNPTELDEGNPDEVARSTAAMPTRPKGPNASAVVLGVVCLALAGLIIANETMTWQVDWSGLGPGAIVVIGAVLLVIGAIGLIRRHDDV